LVDVPGDEQDHDLAQFRRRMRQRAVDIVQPDVCYAGGLTRSLQIARAAESLGLHVLPHLANRSLLLPVSIYLLCAMSRGGLYVGLGIRKEPGCTACWCRRSASLTACLTRPAVSPGRE
jgi:hypothetical protein